MSNLVTFLQDVLEAREKGRPFWSRWLERLEDYYDKRFGSDWKEKDKDFWDNFNYPSRWT